MWLVNFLNAFKSVVLCLGIFANGLCIYAFHRLNTINLGSLRVWKPIFIRNCLINLVFCLFCFFVWPEKHVDKYVLRVNSNYHKLLHFDFVRYLLKCFFFVESLPATTLICYLFLLACIFRNVERFLQNVTIFSNLTIYLGFLLNTFLCWCSLWNTRDGTIVVEFQILDPSTPISFVNLLHAVLVVCFMPFLIFFGYMQVRMNMSIRGGVPDKQRIILRTYVFLFHFFSNITTFYVIFVQFLRLPKHPAFLACLDLTEYFPHLMFPLVILYEIQEARAIIMKLVNVWKPTQTQQQPISLPEPTVVFKKRRGTKRFASVNSVSQSVEVQETTA
ncbi:unnamed protein product [Caenorhabditis angaria]|uniref:Uncharacterized protein n=1 Tax=Caenorhabditis angaria TaxID=860376 RepID=A0A9P1J2V0_9PELO|nr:unnamed protein product [Caenorhabditis angaria]